jgi:hypothetical protein
MGHFQLINMVTIAQKTNNTAVRFYLSLLFVFGSLSLCQAQSTVDTGQLSVPEFQESGAVQQSSAPILSEWQSSYDAMDAKVVSELAVVDVPKAAATGESPGDGPTIAPQLSPEPSTLGLLLAGSAALFRFGRRKRSS